MSPTSKAWIVAASIGAVETLKDQMGVCRWNHAIRSLHQHAKSSLIRPASQAKTKLSSHSSILASGKFREEKPKQADESLRTVMFLSCWGPN